MMKKISLLLCCVAAVNLFAAAIGENAPALTDCSWIKDQPVDVQKVSGKQPVVLFFWNIGYASNQEIAAFAKIVKEYQGKAVFAAIGCDDEAKLRSFFRLPEFPCPVAADSKLKNVSAYFSGNDEVPQVFVIAKGGKLAWRGKTASLANYLPQIISGKYDLAGAARREKFFGALQNAMQTKDFENALKLVNVELACSPDDLDLLIFKLNLMEKFLKQSDEIKKEIDKVIAAKPQVPQLYELKLQYLRKHGNLKAVPQVIAAITRNFANNFVILNHFASLEMKQAPGDASPMGIYMLGKAIVSIPEYSSPREKALAKVVFAQVLEYCGCLVPALKELEEAKKLFTDPKDISRVDALISHYSAIRSIQKTVNR